MDTYLRGLNPNLTPRTWVLLSGSFANALGNGLVLPYLLIYLHNVRGISLGTGGLVLAISSVAALVAGPAAGTLIDVIGPRTVLATSIVVSAIGFGGFALVHSVEAAILAGGLAGGGNGAVRPGPAAVGAG